MHHVYHYLVALIKLVSTMDFLVDLLLIVVTKSWTSGNDIWILSWWLFLQIKDCDFQRIKEEMTLLKEQWQ